MARPGFVLEVDERTPPVLVPDGVTVRLERFPLGTSVVYPPDPGEPVADLAAAVVAALDAPLDAPPLDAQLRPGMRLTITFDDITIPQPPMRRPDVRGRIVEQILVKAAAAGIDDVELICARGLHRRCSPEELERMLGERVFRSFYADGRLTNHDAEDPGSLVALGEVAADTGAGDAESISVQINRRVAESDLVVAVQLVGGTHDGGQQALAQGLGATATVDACAGYAAVRSAAPGAAPGPPCTEQAGDRVGKLVTERVRVFAVTAVLTNDPHAAGLGFLQKREWEQNLLDQAAVQLLRGGLQIAGSRLRQRAVNAVQSSSAVTAVVAGSPAAVQARSRATLAAQQRVAVAGQADVVVAGVGAVSPSSVNSVQNPLLAATSGFAQIEASTSTPLLRSGGAAIMYHPLPVEFSVLHHPSYVDFFAEVLSETTDPALVHEKFEQRFATDGWYRHLYQTSYAFHGVSPFHLWYRVAAAASRCADVIFVGGDREAVARMGFRAASTLADALEIVSSTVGREPRISVLHSPPQVVVDVTGGTK